MHGRNRMMGNSLLDVLRSSAGGPDTPPQHATRPDLAPPAAHAPPEGVQALAHHVHADGHHPGGRDGGREEPGLRAVVGEDHAAIVRDGRAVVHSQACRAALRQSTESRSGGASRRAGSSRSPGAGSGDWSSCALYGWLSP